MTATVEAPAARSSGRRRMQVLVLLGLVLALLTAVLVRHERRDHEWRHGGDKVTVEAGIRVTDAAGFGEALAAAGGTRSAAIVDAQQGFVIKVRWNGGPASGGSYQFVLLDHRVSPARPIRAATGAAPGRGITLGWDGRYEALSQHYAWLAGTEERRLSDGSYADTAEAVGVPARKRGRAMVAFYNVKNANAVTDPARDLELAMFFVDSDGEVRWARAIPLGALATVAP
ncbi:MAG: hypothetical protein ACJ72L_07190 [Marmoricola sp.]